MYENELYHHGVKGMKWGVRRAQAKTQRYENWKNKKNHQIDAKYDKKKMKIDNKYSSKISKTSINGNVEKANSLKAAQKYKTKVNEAYRKVEHTKVKDIDQDDYYKAKHRSGKVVVGQLIAGPIGAGIALGLTSGQTTSTRLSLEERQYYASKVK